MAWIYLCASIVVLIVWQLRRVFKEKSKAPDFRLPGPSGLPIIGNAHQLNLKTPHFSLTEMAHHHGPIYKMKLLTDHWVVVNTYDVARELYITKGREFAGRPESYRFTQAIENGHSFLLGDLNADTILTRKLMSRALVTSGVSGQQIKTVSKDMMDDLFDHWSELAKTDSESEEKKDGYDCKDDILRFTCRMIIKGLVGEDVDHNSAEVDQIMKLENQMVDSVGSTGSGLMLDMFPWLRFLGNREWNLMESSFSLSDTIYSFYKPRIISSMDEGTTQSVMHVVLNQALQENNNIPDVIVQGLMSTLISAALTTTGRMFYIIILVLGDNPHIQEKIQNELESVIGNTTPDVQESDKLPYTMAFIIEVLRNASIGPLSIPRKAVCDTSLSGYDIPQGVNVFINVWNINHDADFWEDPFEYKPERFLSEEGHLHPPEHTTRQRVMTFGAGPRSCIGDVFAKKLLFLFTGLLMQRFHIKINDKGCSDPMTFVLDGVLLRPRTCVVQFVERN